jgi:hypothetical protein
MQKKKANDILEKDLSPSLGGEGRGKPTWVGTP